MKKMGILGKTEPHNCSGKISVERSSFKQCSFRRKMIPIHDDH